LKEKAFMLPKLFNLVIDGALGLLSWIIPKNKRLVILGAGLGQSYAGHPKALHQKLIADPNKQFRALWLTKNPNLQKELLSKGYPTCLCASIKGCWAILRAQWIIIESGTAKNRWGHDIAPERFLFGRFQIMQTWHGSPIKRIALDAMEDNGLNTFFKKLKYHVHKRELKGYDAIVTASESESKILTQAFSNDNIWMLGHPRNDILLDEQHRQVLKKTLGIDGTILLYAPTFRDADDTPPPFTDEDWQRLNQSLKQHQGTLFINKHPFDDQLKIPTQHGHIIDTQSYGLEFQEWLAASDLLISDWSSCFIDYLLTDRPMLFYLYDLEDYQKRSRKMYYDLPTVLPGPTSTTFDTFLSQLEKMLSTNTPYEKYDDIKKMFHYQPDGDAGQRVIQAMSDGRS
jgi:CDP-glycerol glycerophosphotransferase